MRLPFRPVRRLYFGLAALILVVVACSADGSDSSTSERGQGASTEPQVTTTTRATQSGSETTDAAVEPEQSDSTNPATTGTTSSQPLAPDFTLELGDGGTYTLSEGAKPVYLVFWAEW